MSAAIGQQLRVLAEQMASGTFDNRKVALDLRFLAARADRQQRTYEEAAAEAWLQAEAADPQPIAAFGGIN